MNAIAYSAAQPFWAILPTFDAVVTPWFEVFAAFEMLASSPGVGFRRPELTSRPLRFWVVRSYLIAYVPEAQPLQVVAVLHGRRSPRLVAAMLRARS